MGYFVGSVGTLLWVILWVLLVIFTVYCLGIGANLLWVILLGVVVIFTDVSGQPIRRHYKSQLVPKYQ